MSPEKGILYVTRDLSYVGGTEAHMTRLILHVRKKLGPNHRVILYETDGSGRFSNTDVYHSMQEACIPVIEAINPGNNFWNPENARQIRQVIINEGISTVHSFLFNADYQVSTAKIGDQMMQSLLNQIESKSALHGLFPQIAQDGHPSTTALQVHHVSTKFCDYSVAMEEDTPKWALRKRIIDNELEPITSANTDSIHTVSQHSLLKWQQWNKSVSFSPCTSIGLADLALIDKLVPRTELEGRPRETVYTIVSRLVHGKGIEFLIDCFLDHLRQFPNDTLVIGGDGELRDSLKERSAGSPNITFLGELNREQVLQTYTDTDVAVLLSESEGLPLSIQEAMACKRTVLATNVGGVPELVREGNGLLVPVNNRYAVANALARLSTMERSTLAQMGIEGRRVIESDYVNEVVFDNYCNTYDL